MLMDVAREFLRDGTDPELAMIGGGEFGTYWLFENSNNDVLN